MRHGDGETREYRDLEMRRQGDREKYETQSHGGTKKTETVKGRNGDKGIQRPGDRETRRPGEI